jgi:hypothetical protein
MSFRPLYAMLQQQRVPEVYASSSTCAMHRIFDFGDALLLQIFDASHMCLKRH